MTIKEFLTLTRMTTWAPATCVSSEAYVSEVIAYKPTTGQVSNRLIVNLSAESSQKKKGFIDAEKKYVYIKNITSQSDYKKDQRTKCNQYNQKRPYMKTYL